jgi:hypothetical protein
MAKSLTNNTRGPKAVNTSKGQVVLAPGETLSDDFEVSDADRAALEATGFLDADANQTIEPASPQQTAATLNDMGTGGAMGTGNPGKPDGQTADQLVADNSEAQLREIADTEGADVSGAKNKADIAQAIVDKRNAG